MFFQKSKCSQANRRTRTLSLESLETRRLMSTTPYAPPVPVSVAADYSQARITSTHTSQDAVRLAMDTFAQVILKLQTTSGLATDQRPRVDLYESGRLAASELGSDGQITTHSHIYHGAADFVALYGPKGSTFTLYNDQQYRTGQNYLTVVKKTNQPTAVWLRSGFSIEGETPYYSYFFAKQEGNSELNNVSSVAFTSKLARAEDPRIEIYELGKLDAVVLNSDNQIPSHSHTYGGNAESVVLHGPKGTAFTLYNDQQYRTGQNYLTIVKKTDGPITVSLTQAFAAPQVGVNQKYHGETNEYTYYFAKQEGDSQLNNLSSVRFNYSIKPAVDETRVPRVELYEGDPTWSFPSAVLYGSDQQIQTAFENYRGRATYARIFTNVPDYSVTFYDDQNFGGGQNALTITVVKSGPPVLVCLNTNFAAAAGDHDYTGSTYGYNWTLRKVDFWTGNWFSPGKDNVRVDNVSSVQFGYALSPIPQPGEVPVLPHVTLFRSPGTDQNGEFNFGSKVKANGVLHTVTNPNNFNGNSWIVTLTINGTTKTLKPGESTSAFDGISLFGSTWIATLYAFDNWTESIHANIGPEQWVTMDYTTR
jgi:hypothetical protein